MAHLSRLPYFGLFLLLGTAVGDDAATTGPAAAGAAQVGGSPNAPTAGAGGSSSSGAGSGSTSPTGGTSSAGSTTGGTAGNGGAGGGAGNASGGAGGNGGSGNGGGGGASGRKFVGNITTGFNGALDAAGVYFLRIGTKSPRKMPQSGARFKAARTELRGSGSFALADGFGFSLSDSGRGLAGPPQAHARARSARTERGERSRRRSSGVPERG